MDEFNYIKGVLINVFKSNNAKFGFKYFHKYSELFYLNARVSWYIICSKKKSSIDREKLLFE